LFQEMRRIDLLWKIVKYTASLLWIFNVYEFCCFNFLPDTSCRYVQTAALKMNISKHLTKRFTLNFTVKSKLIKSSTYFGNWLLIISLKTIIFGLFLPCCTKVQ
jgi:hypothetical protein